MRRVDPDGRVDQVAGDLVSMLRELANSFGETAIRRLPNEGAAAYGVRIHDLLQNMAHSAKFNFPELKGTNRLITEAIFDAEGRLQSYGYKPTGTGGETTVDFAVLKKGFSTTDPENLVGRRAGEILEVGLDLKTGNARLAAHQRAFFAREGVPLEPLRAGPVRMHGVMPGAIPEGEGPIPPRAAPGINVLSLLAPTARKVFLAATSLDVEQRVQWSDAFYVTREQIEEADQIRRNRQADANLDAYAKQLGITREQLEARYYWSEFLSEVTRMFKGQNPVEPPAFRAP